MHLYLHNYPCSINWMRFFPHFYWYKCKRIHKWKYMQSTCKSASETNQLFHVNMHISVCSSIQRLTTIFLTGQTKKNGLKHYNITDRQIYFDVFLPVLIISMNFLLFVVAYSIIYIFFCFFVCRDVPSSIIIIFFLVRTCRMRRKLSWKRDFNTGISIKYVNDASRVHIAS